MAKWGEGDPRWLVEDRPDAKNVNNWHWTEKNASQWSKDKLKELLVGMKWKDHLGSFEIFSLEKCDGEAAVNNRKAKLIFFYEWVILLKWKAFPPDDDVPITGSLEVVNLSEEHDVKDVDILIHNDKHGPVADRYKEYMRRKGADMVKDQLSTYLKCLKEEFSKGVILPTKDQEVRPAEIKSRESASKRKFNETRPKNNVIKYKATDVGELENTESFKCRAEEFFRVFTTEQTVRAFTNGDCVLNAENGGIFEMYGGNVQGQFIELVPNELIKQRWRFKSWPEGHFSEVTISIKEKTDCTEVHIHQKGIPKSELERTSEGWKRYYWESIKRVFGFGAILI